MRTTKIIRNLVVFGIVITLFLGIGYSYYYSSNILGEAPTTDEIVFMWSITFLMYSIVMAFLALYVAYNEAIKHKSKIKGPLSVGVLGFCIVNVVFVLGGFSPIRFKISATILIILGVSLLFYLVNRYLLKE